MQRTLISVLGFLFVTLVVPSASGQIINVQSHLFREYDDGFHLKLNAAGDYRSGNVEYYKLSLSGIVGFKKGRHTVRGFGGYNYAEKSGKAFYHVHKEHLRYQFALNKWFGLETFAQHEYNEFKRLSFRALGGGGAYLSHHLSSHLHFIFGLSLMGSALRYSESTEETTYEDSGEHHNFLRLSTYFMVLAKIKKDVQVVGTFYYQPELSEFSNYLYLGEIALLVSLSGWLQLKLSYANSFNSTPPETIEQRDQLIQMGLQFDMDPLLKKKKKGQGKKE